MRLRSAAWLAAPAAFWAVFFARPLTAMLQATTVAAWRWLTTPYVQDRFAVAVEQALWSLLLTLAIAVPLAWLYHRRRLQWTRLHLAVHAAPFVLPVFIIVFGIQTVLGNGGWTDRAFGVSAARLGGPMLMVVLAHAYYNYGFAARLIHAALERRPHRMEEAANVLGAAPGAAFWRVTLPLLAPTLAAVALLVFLFCFTSFGVVLYLGGGEVATLETLMYENLRGAFARPERAAALGIVQLFLSVLLLWSYMALRRRQARVPAARRSPSRASWRSGVLSWALLAAGLAPVVAVLAGGFRFAGEWSLEPWRALLQASHPAHLPGFHVGDALGLSLFYAACSAALSLSLAAMLGYGSRRLGGPVRRAADVLASLPLATSSLLIGFGFTLTFGLSWFVDTWQARLLIIAAHALVSFPFTARTLLPALDAHEARLDEAAALLGAGPWRVVARIHWPLLRGPVLVAAGFAVAMSLGDFGASLLLQSAENRGLLIWIDAFRGVTGFDPLMRAQALALSGLLLFTTAVAYVAMERVGGADSF